MRTSRFRQSLAAGASVAIAAAGLAAFAPTATAASGDMTFDCTFSLLGVKPTKTVADTNLPEKVELGKEINVGFTATVSAPDDIRSTAIYLYGKEVEGTATVDTTVGADKVPATATVPRTTIPETENTELVINVAGSGKWKPTALGKQEVKLTGYTASLSFPQPTGAPKTLQVPCVPNAATSTLIDTVEVVPAATPTPTPTPEPPAADVQKTETSAKVKYKKKAKKVVTKVQVANEDDTAASGDVKVILKKGKKKVGKAQTVTLNKKGKKKVVFKKVAGKGKYTLIAKYKGSDESKKSMTKVKFKIKK